MLHPDEVSLFWKVQIRGDAGPWQGSVVIVVIVAAAVRGRPCGEVDD